MRGLILASALALILALLAPTRAGAQVALSGLSGYWNTPQAEVLGDGKTEVGYNVFPKRWAYDHRGVFQNGVYFATLGFVSRVEISLRVTSLPGFRTYTEVDSLSRLTDADRMVSGKVQLVRATGFLPDFALGVEDPSGTRRFHTAYFVMGRGFRLGHIRMRADAGYAGALFHPVTQTTLDGVFGGAEARLAEPVAVAVEYDTEKWNVGIKVRAPLGFNARLVWLSTQQLTGGLGLSFTL